MKKFSHPKPRLLFLYSELASYFIACIEELVRRYEVEVHVIHWPVNNEAPFAFNLPRNISFYDKKGLPGGRLKEKLEFLQPDFIYCSGWMDKDYLKAVKGYKKIIPVAMGLDTWWEGKPAQYLACLASPFAITPLFSHCWVPGLKQKKYALKLGFKQEQIMMNYYSADTDYFTAMGEKAEAAKKIKYPHRFLYVGRYYHFKGITDMWNAFIEWKNEKDNDWELWCLGTGTVPPAEHPSIRHFGFVQPASMEGFIRDAGAAIVPSRFEPWGVALHEFASAGLPIICSTRVGAAEAFLEDGRNGYLYPAGDVVKLKQALNAIADQSDDTLLSMGMESRRLALKITPLLWADTLMKLVKP